MAVCAGMILWSTVPSVYRGDKSVPGHQRSSGDACTMSVITSAATQSAHRSLDGVYLRHPRHQGAPAVCDGRLEPFAPSDWGPRFLVKGEAGLPIVIRCHSGFRISRIELVHSLPPHGYKCIGSEFVH